MVLVQVDRQAGAIEKSELLICSDAFGSVPRRLCLTRHHTLLSNSIIRRKGVDVEVDDVRTTSGFPFRFEDEGVDFTLNLISDESANASLSLRLLRLALWPDCHF